MQLEELLRGGLGLSANGCELFLHIVHLERTLDVGVQLHFRRHARMHAVRPARFVAAPSAGEGLLGGGLHLYDYFNERMNGKIWLRDLFVNFIF